MQRPIRWIAATAAAVTSVALVATSASAAPPTDSSALRDAVTVEGVMEHEREFQAIADANGDSRASGTPGYDASVAYVVGKLEAAGYDVTLQPFTYEQFVETSSAMERTSRDPHA